MNKPAFLSAVALVFVALPKCYPQVNPPTTFVDRGACPFECCTYREWKTEKTTIAYARADRRSKRIGKFTAGSKVIALTGIVYSMPRRFLAIKPYGKYKPGDIILGYTSYGEGSYKVWFRGRMYTEGLEEDGPWGKWLDKEHRSTWWIKIKSEDGWVGWTNQGENFSGSDACGG